MKKKILVCSESSKVPSGFGVYNKRLLETLYKHPNYEVAEFATYGFIGDKEKFNIPWKYYPNAVTKEDKRYEQYNQSLDNQFGKWRFDRVLLDFRPDIVIDIRDYWMSYFEGQSQLRQYFKWFLMPTVDSAPQKEDWLDTYINADLIFTYSDWGMSVLKQQTNNAIKCASTVSPGVNLQEFNIETDSIQTRKALLLNPEFTILGTIMRNQKRKLYPELIRAFERVINELDPQIAKNTILYLHTGYPDAGWDFAELVKNSPVSNKIYFTYVCRACGAVFASTFADILQPCQKCGNKAAMMPNINNPLDTNVLAKVINCFDLYIQYAICEGFGMPQIEAAACGVPIMTVDYSAMIDVIQKLEAIPIKVGSYFKELETSAIRVYPDEDDAVNKIVKFVNTPPPVRKRIGFKTRELAEKYYNWDDIAKDWIKYIDDCETTQHLWNLPVPLLIEKIDPNKLPKFTNVFDLGNFLQKNYLEKLNIKTNSMWLLKGLTYASRGMIIDKNETKKYTMENLINDFNHLIDHHNICETARVNPSVLHKEDYIDYANGVLDVSKN